MDDFDMIEPDHHEKPYEIISCKSLVAEFYKSITSVSEMLEISPTCARLLLSLAHWETNETIAFFYEREEPEILKVLGVTRSSLYSSGSKTAFQIDEYTEFGPKETCPICCEDAPPVRFGFLCCGHRFCVSCWARFIEAQVSGSANCKSLITCIEPQCKEILEDGYVPQVAASSRVATLFQKSCEAKFVNSRPNLRYCGGADCENAAVVSSSGEVVHFKCPCGNYQCSGCGKEGHEGIPCWLFEQWLAKISVDNDSESLRYLVSNTKPCPKCKNNIEKNGGCNHMTCRSCHAHFCWLCLCMFDKDMDIYSHVNSCTIFSGDTKTANLAGRHNGDSQWDWAKRFVFYSDRYGNHIKSMKNEKKLLHKLKCDLHATLVEAGRCATHDDFFQIVLDVLTESRRTLSQCYGFLYYVRRCAQQDIFNFNLESLETNVELLSAFVEKELTLTKYSTDVRQQVITKYRNCQTRRQHLINHLVEGFEKKWWEFNNEL